MARFWDSANLRIALSPLEAEAKKIIIIALRNVVFMGWLQLSLKETGKIWFRVSILGAVLSTSRMFAEILKASCLESH